MWSASNAGRHCLLAIDRSLDGAAPAVCRKAFLTAVGVGLLGLGMRSARADQYFNGGSTDFSDPANWSTDAANDTPGAVPGPTDTAYFGVTSYGGGQTVFLNAPQSVLGLNVSGTATVPLGAMTLSSDSTTPTNGTNTLTVGTGGVTNGAYTGVLTLNSTMVLNGNQTWASDGNPGGANIFVNGNITGTGNLNLTGNFNIAGPDNNFAGNLHTSGIIDIFGDFNTNTAYTTTIASGIIGAHNTINFAEPIVFTGGTTWYTNNGSANFSNSLTGGQLNLVTGGTYTVSGSTNNTTNISTGGTTFLLDKTSSPTVHAVGTFFEVVGGSTAQIIGTGGYQFGTTTVVQLDYNNASSYGTLDFNGDSESFSGLVGGSAAGGGIITNTNAGTTSTLTIGANNPNSTFYGTIQDGSGAVALTKIGTGTQVLAGSNTYSGDTNVNAGTLNFTANNIANPGRFLVNGGTLLFSGSGIATTGAIIVNSGTLGFAGSGNTFSSPITLNTGTSLTLNTSTYTNTNTNLVNSLSPNSTVTLNGASLVIQAHTSGNAVPVTGDFALNSNFAHNITTDTSGLTAGQTITLPAGVLPNGATTTTIQAIYDGGKTILFNALAAENITGVTITPTAINFTTTDTIQGLVLNSGSNSVTTSLYSQSNINNTGAGSAVLNLNGITRSNGSTIDFTLPAGTQSALNGITTTTANTAGTILGGWATVAGTDWAVSGGTGSVAGNITPIASYDSTWAPGKNIDVTSSGVSFDSSNTVNSVRFNSGGTTTVTLPGPSTISSGGILITNASSSTAPTITGGSLTSGNGSSLIVNQFNTANPLTLATPIVNPTAPAASIGLTKSGSGALTLTSSNTYTGPTIINAGTVNVTNTSTLGTNSAVTLHGGSTLNFTNLGSQINLQSIGATATASTDPQPASNAIDGNINTRWESVQNVDPQWIELNLTSVYNLASLAISWEAADAKNFVIETATNPTADPDGTSDNGWSVVDTVTNNPSYGDKHFVNYGLAAGASGQYIAMFGTARAIGYGYSIWEMNVYQGAGAFTQSIGSLSSSDSTAVTNLDAQLTLSTGSDNSSTTYAGVISGGGGLLKVGTGTLNLTNSNTYSGGTNVSGGTLVLSTVGALPVGSNLIVASGGTVKSNISAGSVALQVGSLSVLGKLDLNSNSLDVHSTGLAAVTSMVQAGYSNGTWNGSSGITSSLAANDSKHLSALGTILNDNGSGKPLYGTGGTLASTFGGVSPADGDVLVKYTYYGDTNLNGSVDGSDYSRVDAAYLNNLGSSPKLTGWYNGDFNYDGVINGSDYTLIDNAFNSQGAQIATELASPNAIATAQIAGASGSSAVPEPTMLSLLGIGAVGLLGRRRRNA